MVSSRAPAATRPLGTVTRGTTHRNRLRRMDRWIASVHGAALRRADQPPLAVDLGYGAAPWTAVELLARLRRERPDLRVTGVEIDPARVTAAAPHRQPGLDFVHGGFEIPLPGGPRTSCPRTSGDGNGNGDGRRGDTDRAGGRNDGDGRPLLIRAANVLRQYTEDEVPDAWDRLRHRLAPDGLVVEGTCDEIGRRHVWVALGPEGPRTVTFAARLGCLTTPSDLAERLPKALIHRNVPGEPVHAFLRDFDRAWATAAPWGALSARQRWVRTATALRGHWPVIHGPGRWRHGELTLAWSALAPR